MPLQPIEEMDFGGVDSRSNPINLPKNRLLRCLNWVPKQAGYLELRWGYSTVSMSAVSPSAITGLISYRLWNASKFVLIFQGTSWNTFALATGTVSTPTIRGAAIASAAPGNAYFFNNRAHYGNGTDQKFFDGTVWRDNGIRVPTTAEAAACTVSAGTTDVNGIAPAILSGYQFWAAYYNPVSGHVGNAIPIGARLANTASTVDVNFVGLPQMSTVGGNNSAGDSEWKIVFGRSGDGALVAYVCVDSVNNWITAPNTATTFTLTSGAIDGTFALPTRNGIIPAAETMFATVGDFIYACDPNSPTVRYSGSQLDTQIASGQFMGKPEQSWAPDDIETFPTAEAVTCLAETDLTAFVATLNDCAILTNASGIISWTGPWPKGCAGARASTKSDHGFYWLSADKELCTFVNGLPTVASEEYEIAELSQLGDAYMATVELRYFRDKTRGKDEIRIEGRKADGTPYTVIHDFKLIEGSAFAGSYVSSPAGQGYSSQFSGPLGTSFTSIVVRDTNNRFQIFAGSSLGQLYQLYTGADDVGVQYAADAIGLVNAGPERPSVPYFDWYGDSQIVISIGKTLKTDLTSDQNIFVPLESNVVQGYEDDFRYRATLPAPELHHTYFRFQLTSHSADGNLSLSSPPHLPLESYGRIYEFLPMIGDTRGA